MAQDRSEETRTEQRYGLESDRDLQGRAQPQWGQIGEPAPNETDWRDERARRRQDERSRRRQGQSRQRLELEPLGWVRIATDYDDDGQYDDVDWIYYYDLRRAQQRSRERDRAADRRDWRRSDEQQRQQARSGDEPQRWQKALVRGTIRNTRTVTMFEGDEALIATIETDSGEPTRVCMGSKDRLDRLDLQKGDRVIIDGHRALLNDQRIVMADRVWANGESVGLSRRESLESVQGEVVSMRTTSFRNRDGEYVVARVRTRDDDEHIVNLGPKERVAQLDLREGDRILVMGYPGRINEQEALIARQLNANDQTIQIGQRRASANQRR